MEDEWKNCWKKQIKIQYREVREVETIKTREGELKAYPDKDYLLKGLEGEIYPCKKDIFEKTYTTKEPTSNTENPLAGLDNETLHFIYAPEENVDLRIRERIEKMAKKEILRRKKEAKQ
ncbi:MAG: hypothetical protein ACOC5T_07705 [Elusimicrobiota bacterium]